MKLTAEFLAQRLDDGDHSYSTDAANMLRNQAFECRHNNQLMEERDYLESVVTKMAIEVLGDSFPGWSSAYGYEDALIDVEIATKNRC